MTQTPDFMTDMMDQARQTVEAGVQASTRMWDATTRFATLTPVFSPRFEDIKTGNERMTRNFAPVMRESFDLFAGAMNAQVRSNLDFFKRTIDKTHSGKDVNWSAAAQETMRDAFGTMRSGFDVVAETGTKMMKSWASLFGECCGEKCDAKAAPKPVK
ncbi:MAG: hypothetical protein KJ057_06585 [Phycisphaerae bacterium]|nr:MAG: hypothetical protein F9K17_12835 [Phycisphaerae bacterium]MBE7456709.1 hypothetical protein [Planctomycetia bacterium]MCK6463914.1 hypothetical protein [Phycisphaerae bacterium]MCL4718127.1 hypothetical protein [Phycisphaerae bacterium]NUQ09806.1 hypothetical protein [Phycisphaerae bacterium]